MFDHLRLSIALVITVLLGLQKVVASSIDVEKDVSDCLGRIEFSWNEGVNFRKRREMFLRFSEHFFSNVKERKLNVFTKIDPKKWKTLQIQIFDKCKLKRRNLARIANDSITMFRAISKEKLSSIKFSNEGLTVRDAVLPPSFYSSDNLHVIRWRYGPDFDPDQCVALVSLTFSEKTNYRSAYKISSQMMSAIFDFWQGRHGLILGEAVSDHNKFGLLYNDYCDYRAEMIRIAFKQVKHVVDPATHLTEWDRWVSRGLKGYEIRTKNVTLKDYNEIGLYPP